MVENENKIKELEDVNMALRTENELLKREVKGLRFQLGINKTILGFHEQNLASAAADLIINKELIKIHGTLAGIGMDFMVGLMNILVIESDRRGKNIYLKEPVIPKDEGKKYNKILCDGPKLNFEKMLRTIQENGHHLIRVNKSLAINIYHYNLSEKNFFELSFLPPKGFKRSLVKIKTDSKFDATLYHTRLMEIDRLSKHHQDFAINLKKIEEISRYKNKPLVTIPKL